MHKWIKAKLHFFATLCCFGSFFFIHTDSLALEDLTKEKLIQVLSDQGLVIGSDVWLRHPVIDIKEFNTIPGLSKVKIKDLDVGTKNKFSKSDKHIVMAVEIDSSEKILELSHFELFFGAPLTSAMFYIEDPRKLTEKWGKKVLRAIAKGEVFRGMTKEQVRASWGNPTRINTSGGRWGIHEQWVYGETMSSYLYFENGRMSSWQN